MEPEALRALQTPLKEGYKADPKSALVGARAEGLIEGDGIECRVHTHVGESVVGLHRAAGGDGTVACSADMLMEALAGCAGVTMKAVATAMRLPFTRARVVAEGTWDARGTLAVDREVPVGLTDVTLTFEIESDAAPEKIAKLVDLTERYCVVYQTLAASPRLETPTKITPGG